MKIIKYLLTFIIPGKMNQRKNMNAIITFLLMLLGSYVVAVPYMVKLKQNAYETLELASYYDFRIFNDEYSREIVYTEEDAEKYEMITFTDFQRLNFKIENGFVTDTEKANYNFGQEYVLKRQVDFYDLEGTIIEQKNYFIHIVFDIYDIEEEPQYDFTKKFDTLYAEEGDFCHFLLVFYPNSFIYRNNYIRANAQISYPFEYKKIEINFIDMDKLSYLSHKVIDILIPSIQLQYTFNSFIYVLLIPTIISLAAWLIIRKNGQLNNFKQFYNIAGMATITTVIVFFIIEWIPFFIRIGVMEYYMFVFALYYFLIVSIVNRQQRIE